MKVEYCIKMFDKFNLFFVLSFAIDLIQVGSISAQTVPTISSEVTTTSDGLETTTRNETVLPEIPEFGLNICSENDTLSSKHCSCSSSVISCDFSHYADIEKVRISPRLPSESSIKRVCFCNSPSNMLLNLTLDLIPNADIRIHRVDLENLKGPLHFFDAFMLNFAGDIYIKNVHYLRKIHTRQFGRGYDFPIEDVEASTCCSSIKSPQIYSRPTLFMDNVIIGGIDSQGIDSMHLWKTVILNSVEVHEMNTSGINFNSNQKMNISITNCHFDYVDTQGIRIQNFENLLMAKTIITSNGSPTALDFRSTVLNSTAMIVDNKFDNLMVLSMDAHRVLNWFNIYDAWREDTFYYLNSTEFQDRIVSIEYNTLMEYLINDTSYIPKPLASDTIIINENVLGMCNCSKIRSGIVLPDYFQSSRCENVKANMDKGYCLLDFKAINTSCIKDSRKDSFLEMCGDKSISVSSYHGHSFEDVKTKATGLNINSPFLTQMIKGVKNLFHVHHVLSHLESDEETYDENSGKGSSSKSTSDSGGHLGLYVFLSLLGIFIATVVVAFFVRRRRSALSGTQPLSESYDVLTTAT